MRIAEEGLQSGFLCELVMQCELVAVVEGNSVAQSFWYVGEEAAECCQCCLRSLVGPVHEDGEAGRAFADDEGVLAIGVEEHEVRLPVARLLAGEQALRGRCLVQRVKLRHQNRTN